VIIYPSIDIRSGQVVRLREGRADQQTVFGNDPVAAAQRWIDEGAAWLHVVNLDGAFADANDNLAVVEKIAALGTSVQFGGGIRSIDHIGQALALGITRVVVGTVAAQNPQIVAEAVAKYGAEAICVGLDARDGKITTHGWQTATDLTPVGFGRQLRELGAIHALYTDVNRDGGLSGSNVEGTITLGRETGLQVIASGGVSSVKEISALNTSGTVAGAIIGMALYTGQLSLADALEAAKEK
jgi:phosphoribosylformimino-5-aminoimidazole carboxamide ribotide isomerase